jgi:hypothetical protein
MTEKFCLGRCHYTSGSGWAKFEVLAQWDEQEGWQEINREARRSAFPNEGMMWSADAAIRTVVKDSFWTFTSIDNPRYPASAKEKYQAVTAVPATEILDLRSLRKNENVRRAIVERGLDLDRRPTTDVCIRLSENTCVFVRLTQHANDEMRWKAIDLSSLRHTSIRNFDSRFGANRVDGRLFLPPNTTENLEIRQEDWSPDADFFERLLRHIRRAEPLFDRKPSNAEIEQIIRKLQDTHVFSMNAVDNELLSQRLQGFLPTLEKNITRVRAVVECLMEFSAVKAQLDLELVQIKTRIASELRDQLEPYIRAELEASLAEVRQRKEHELAALEHARTASEQLREQITELSAAQAEARSALASELQTIVLLAREAKTPELLADVAARYAIRIRMPIEQSPAERELDTPPWIHVGPQTANSIDWSELSEILRRAAAVFGVDGPALLTLDVLTRAAQVPVLFGAGVGETVRAYAFSVVGGDLYRYRVDPTTIALDDLWRHPGSGEPTAIAHAWRAAEAHRERTTLLLIDGLDAAPSEFWFDLWCDIVRSERRPPNLLVITALSDGFVQGPKKSFDVFLAGAPLWLESQKMTMGDRLKILLGRDEVKPTTLRGITGDTIAREERVRFGLTVADQEAPSMDFLRRAASIHSVAFHTYGVEMATEMVQDFSRSLCLVTKPEASRPERGLLTDSVMNLRKLLGVRDR